MRTCEHSIPLDDLCPKCEAIADRQIERKAELQPPRDSCPPLAWERRAFGKAAKPVPVYTSKDAALDAMIDRDEEYERATGDEQMRRDERVMGR